MSRLEVLREQVGKVERQYEKDKPLVNLVDNMVKLGALYRTGSMQWNRSTMNSMSGIDQLHLNQQIQEQKFLLDERREWDKLSPRQIELHVSDN